MKAPESFGGNVEILDLKASAGFYKILLVVMMAALMKLAMPSLEDYRRIPIKLIKKVKILSIRFLTEKNLENIL